MSDVIEEHVSVEKLHPDMIRISYYRKFGLPFNVVFDNEFIFQSSTGRWLCEQLVLAADDKMPDTDTSIPPDNFTIYNRGAMRYDPINVNVINLRDASAPYGKTYALSGLSSEQTLALVALIREKL